MAWHAARCPAAYDPTHEQRSEKKKSCLAAKDGEDALCVDEAGVAKVVQAVALEDGRARLEPHALDGGAVALQDLGRHAAQRAKHGPASVDDLKLAVPAERLGVCGQASGVPAVVTWELTCTRATLRLQCRWKHWC